MSIENNNNYYLEKSIIAIHKKNVITDRHDIAYACFNWDTIKNKQHIRQKRLNITQRRRMHLMIPFRLISFTFIRNLSLLEPKHTQDTTRLLID